MPSTLRPRFWSLHVTSVRYMPLAHNEQVWHGETKIWVVRSTAFTWTSPAMLVKHQTWMKVMICHNMMRRCEDSWTKTAPANMTLWSIKILIHSLTQIFMDYFMGLQDLLCHIKLLGNRIIWGLRTKLNAAWVEGTQLDNRGAWMCLWLWCNMPHVYCKL